MKLCGNEGCTNEMHPQKGNHKYCSDKCRRAVKNIKIRQYRKENPDTVIIANQKTYLKFRDKRLKYSKKYNTENRIELNKYQNKYVKTRATKEPAYALIRRLRASIPASLAFHRFRMTAPVMEYLGCTREEFALHIESQFENGMSWGNRDKWQLDHIFPIGWWETEEEAFIYSHYSNFQPLWANDNLLKKDKFIGHPNREPHKVKTAHL